MKTLLHARKFGKNRPIKYTGVRLQLKMAKYKIVVFIVMYKNVVFILVVCIRHKSTKKQPV